MQNKAPTKVQLSVFIFGLALILGLFSHKALRVGNPPAAALLLVIAAVLLIIYFLNKNLVVQFYHVWMRGVSVIGMVVTGILMILLFYLVFSPVGLILRLIRKDILHLSPDSKLKTYWIDKPRRAFDKSNYEKQF